MTRRIAERIGGSKEYAMKWTAIPQRCEACEVAITHDGWCELRDAGDAVDGPEAFPVHATRLVRRHKCGKLGQEYPVLLCDSCAPIFNPTPAKE